MSSQASPALLDERRQAASQRFNRAVDAMVNSFIASIRNTNPVVAEDPAFRARVRADMEARLRNAAR
jgi:hypothetical protein